MKKTFLNFFDFLGKELLNQTWFFLCLLILVSFFLRIWHLGAIKEPIFDEVYFVAFAKNYLTHVSFFDIHPPLGKLILAIGIKIFGDNQFGQRIMPAIFGTALIPLGYLAAKELMAKAKLNRAKIVGLFTALILTLDGMLLVYSRVGLMDIFLVFFIVLSFYLFLKFANTQKILYLFFSGVAVGLAASVKYNGALLILIFLIIILVRKIPFLKNLLYFVLFLGLVPIIIYLSFFLFNFPLNNQFLHEVLNWHIQSFNYNLTLTEGHPYASKWWGWFLLLRPIWLYFKDLNGQYIGVDGIGNPLLWWSAIVVLPLLIWGVFKRSKVNLIILSSFLIFCLFWAFFSRVLFQYHAIPAFTFLAFGIAYWLERLLQVKSGNILVAVYFLAVLAIFIYFLPIWMGLPISSANFYHHIWLKGWI